MIPAAPASHTSVPELQRQIAPALGRLPALEPFARRWGEIESYGANWMLARRLGLTKPLETYATINWNHGVCDIGQNRSDVAAFTDVLNYQFPNGGRDRAILVETERAQNLLRQAGYARAHAVGLPFLYEKQELDTPRMPRSVLAFATHSTPWFSLFDRKVNPVDGRSKDLEFPRVVAGLRDHFDVVAGCVGASDVLLGNWVNAYEHNGVPWITGAWIHDINALRRMQRILRSFEYVVTNTAGSHIFYALYCGCKVFWHDEDSDANWHHVGRLDPTLARLTEAENARQSCERDARLRELYPFLFCAPENAVARPDVGGAVIGEPHRRAPEEIAELLGWRLKPVSKRKWTPKNSADCLLLPELMVEFNAALARGDVARLGLALDSFVVRGKVPQNAFLGLAQCFVKAGKLDEAKRAAERELEFHAANANARQLIAAIDGPVEPTRGGAAPSLAAEPKRILFLAHGPGQVNGPNIWLTRLLPALKARGFAPRVLMFMTRSDTCPIAERLRAAGVPCEQAPFAHTEDMIRTILRHVQERACDLFVPNLNVQGYFAAEHLRAAGIPTVGVLHSDDDFHRDLVDEFIRGRSGRYLSGAVVVSEFQAAALREMDCGATQVLQSPYGAPVPVKAAEFSAQPFRFVYVGRLVEEQKRVSETVVAMIEVLRRHPNAEFAICGDGSARPAVEKLIAQAKLGERVKLLGNLPSEQVQAVLLASQAFVLLSDYEGIPIALMEAMACGLVPLCTRIRSGVGELIRSGENGFFVADRGADFVATAERLIADRELWTRCSRAARASIEQRFSVEANADNWAAFLNSLIAAAPCERRAVAIPAEFQLPPVRTNPKGIAREDRRLPKPAMNHAAPHPFTNPPLEINNVDLYWTRASILRAVREAAPQFHGVFLDIGCGVMPYRDIIRQAAPQLTRYLGLDLEGSAIYRAEVDLRWDGRKIPLEDASVDSAMLTEVLEHCPEPWVVLKEARRVLKPGGVLFFTVPYIWPLHDAPWDFFRYTPFALEKLLAEAGFADVKLQALGGWNASLAQMIGLWLKRAPLATETRQKMARELWPLFQELVRTDQLPTDPKAGNTMATGWTGLAHVPVAETAAPARRTAGDLPVVLVRSHEFNYSETFVEDHVNLLSSNLTLVYGYPFPRFLRGGKSVLPAATEQKIQTALTAKAPITAELWAEYTLGLAQFLRGAGAKAALVETGLMGAFVHEACAQAKLPFVVHFHGVDAFGRELLESWLPHYRKFFGSAASVLAVSRAMQAQLLQLGSDAERTLLAPYGVAVDLPALAAPVKAPPHFVAVGRFVEKKAPHLTLQAFATVHRVMPEVRLVMIGDGPLLATCQKWAAENGLADAVTFAGVQSRDEVSRRMAASRAFVQHSMVAANGDSEGLPLAILEAGAHGLPVVSTRHAGIPDAVREGVDGFLVNEKDVTAMAEAMLRLAQDPELAAQLGASFRERVVAHYSRAHSLERLHGIMVAAAEGRSAREFDANESTAVVAEPEAPLTPRQVIARDRNDLNAYLELAAGLLDGGKLSGAYLAVAEAHRLSGGSEQTTDALKQLESHGVLDDPQIETYRARAGWTSRAPSANPRRILVVTNLLPPQEMGGYGRTVWEFSRELMARGHVVRVLTADMPHLLRKPTAEHEAFETNVRRSLKLFGDWTNGSVVIEPDLERRKEIVRENHQTILREIDEFGAEAIMAGNLDLVGHFFIQVALDRGIPVLHRLGNAYPGYEPAQSPQGPLFCLAGCSAWVNEGIRAKAYPISRYEVVPPGSPLTEYFRAWTPQRDRLQIAYAGLLMPYKGAHVLVNALAHLARAGIDFECTLAGDTTRPEYLESMRAVATEHGFLERLHFPGFLGKAELAALYARSNVLVFPSVFEEPFGKTQIEAMAAGLLVISSGSGGASEIVEHGKSGLLFKAGDARALAERLAAVQQNPAAAEKIALAGQARAFEFTTEASVDRIEAVFDELLAVGQKSTAPAVAGT